MPSAIISCRVQISQITSHFSFAEHVPRHCQLAPSGEANAANSLLHANPLGHFVAGHYLSSVLFKLVRAAGKGTQGAYAFAAAPGGCHCCSGALLLMAHVLCERP